MSIFISEKKKEYSSSLFYFGHFQYLNFFLFFSYIIIYKNFFSMFVMCVCVCSVLFKNNFSFFSFFFFLLILVKNKNKREFQMQRFFFLFFFFIHPSLLSIWWNKKYFNFLFSCWLLFVVHTHTYTAILCVCSHCFL